MFLLWSSLMFLPAYIRFKMRSIVEWNNYENDSLSIWSSVLAYLHRHLIRNELNFWSNSYSKLFLWFVMENIWRKYSSSLVDELNWSMNCCWRISTTNVIVNTGQQANTFAWMSNCLSNFLFLRIIHWWSGIEFRPNRTHRFERTLFWWMNL